jgi:predicted permease
MIGRLKPGVSLSQARAQLPAVGEAFRREHPAIPKDFRFTLAVEPLQEYFAGNVRLNLLLLFGAVALLLLIACFNLAGIMLARLSARRKEIAMRLALGSGRARLFRQFFIENFLVTAAGGVAGLAAASVLLKGAIAAIPFQLNTAGAIGVDSAVMAFSLGVALLTALAMSSLPAGAANRLNVHESLKSGSRTGAFGLRQRARGILVVGQVALSVTMLVSAGLLIASLYHLYGQTLGFRPAGLTTVTTTFPADRTKSGPALWQIESEEFARLRALPGVRQVAAINVLPLIGWSNFPTERENHPESGIGGMEIRAVSPAYFDVMGIAVKRGRSFAEDDASTAPAALIVSETVARRWWHTADPLGDRVVIGRFQGRDIGKPTPRSVVGVVADVKTAIKDKPWPVVYIPLAQDADFTGAPTWVLRGTPGPGFAAELRKAILSVDPRQRIGEVRTMDAVVSSTTADTRFNAWLFGSLAGIALALTVIGIYGLLSFSVARRTNEIGTRMALGASRFAVLSLILRQGLGLILAGLVFGLAGAYGVTRFIKTLLFSVKPTDTTSFVAVSALLIVAGLLASYLPARRALRIDPMKALREE